MGSQKRLFVYGTLRKGFPNPMAAVLSSGALWIGTAKMRGRLYHINGYPGLVRHAGHPEDWVTGDLYEIPSTRAGDELSSALDRYEGEEYCRVRRTAWMATTIYPDKASGIRCWVWWYQLSVFGLQRVVGGDYLRKSAG